MRDAGDDVRELERLEEQLRQMSDRDSLTGLFNRRRFEEEIAEQLTQAKRHCRAGALLLIDIDAFRFVNDSFGHQQGDALLRQISAILGDGARETDVLARLDGDEFALLLREVDEESALVAGGRVIEAIKDRSQPTVGASIGIATFDGSAELTSSDLLVSADIALYESKESGRGQAVLYTGKSGESLTWVQRIRSALAEDRFVVYAQPIVDLKTRQVARDELLVRMVDRDGEVIPPASFIPTAQRFGLIEEIDHRVLGKAIELAGRSRPIAVNISGRSLSDPRLLAETAAAFEAGLNPNWLSFEITETAAVANMEDAQRFAESVAALGCSLGLDDFGTGFSSFSYLKHLPVQFLKIDMEFIRDLRSSRVDQRLVGAMVEIAAALDMDTVAAGVEDAETLALVQGLGIDFAQGYHIGRPFLVDEGGLEVPPEPQPAKAAAG
jgi:diguanylate cyclase (GGDEF)-like protein